VRLSELGVCDLWDAWERDEVNSCDSFSDGKKLKTLNNSTIDNGNIRRWLKN
jgi:hypothetical protein